MSSPDAPAGEDLTLHAAVYKVVEANIASGRLRAGMLLRETALAAEFAVSRVPVGRALRELAERGKLERLESRGFRVPGTVPEPPPETPRLAIPESVQELARGRASWEKIYERVERDLIAAMPFGRFKIIELGMAEYYGVSRTVTGDLLARLQERGLVERLGRSSSQVPALSEELMRDLYEVRIQLEPAALAGAAPFLVPADLAAMRDTLRRGEQRYPDVPIEELDGYERRLHVDFLERTPNRRLLAALRTSQLPLLATNHLLKRYLGPPEVEPFLAEHRIVVELLLQGATEAAAGALRAHLQASCVKGIARIDEVRRHHQPEIPPFLQPVP